MRWALITTPHATIKAFTKNCRFQAEIPKKNETKFMKKERTPEIMTKNKSQKKKKTESNFEEKVDDDSIECLETTVKVDRKMAA